ncbi:hypothetical protein KFL_007590010 [Klebsormidium nitens]|uniref:Thioredoxin domain-containing protein n=1 Tax=Klebsormidium nitens TaxID=105231 RepID=A0A1Y1IRL4_KLENI|nr:hypothetical protein KFL_007590010 [Klebsormidium nitens]|eukprot:GAQ91287.1 hypothetical protein KFL_007590010 [Klebsormidium nitens]
MADMPAAIMQQVIENQVLTAAKAVEEHLDAQLDRLDKLDEDDIEAIRERRLAEMKRLAAKKQEWAAKGHGDYREIPTEKDFFSESKSSERVVCHFYRENWPCKVVDKHLSILAKEHLETKFVKLDAEKSPFLCERLRIFMLPTIAIIKNGKAEDYVVGFDELGGSDDFGTEVLEERLARTGVIFADGLGGDGASRRKAKGPSEEKRSIRKGGARDDGSDDDDE